MQRSAFGTSRHFAVLQSLAAIGVIADTGQAAPNTSHDEYVAICSAAMLRNLAPGQTARRAGRAIIQARMEKRMPIGFDDLVDDVMTGVPETIRVFLEFKMRCVGCPIACFHTVDDACREHGVDRDRFLNALRTVVAEVMASSARRRRGFLRRARAADAVRAARCVAARPRALLFR